MFCVELEDKVTSVLARWRDHTLTLDWDAMRRVSPEQAYPSTDDETLGSLEFHGGRSPGSGHPYVELGKNELTLTVDQPAEIYPSYAAFARDSAEAQRIQRYFAFAGTMTIYGLVELARKLARRLEEIVAQMWGPGPRHPDHQPPPLHVRHVPLLRLLPDGRRFHLPVTGWPPREAGASTGAGPPSDFAS
jgi:hypothetical protein